MQTAAPVLEWRFYFCDPADLAVVPEKQENSFRFSFSEGCLAKIPENYEIT
jgi:hypothetical protein